MCTRWLPCRLKCGFKCYSNCRGSWRAISQKNRQFHNEPKRFLDYSCELKEVSKTKYELDAEREQCSCKWKYRSDLIIHQAKKRPSWRILLYAISNRVKKRTRHWLYVVPNNFHKTKEEVEATNSSTGCNDITKQKIIGLFQWCRWSSRIITSTYRHLIIGASAHFQRKWRNPSWRSTPNIQWQRIYCDYRKVIQDYWMWNLSNFIIWR